MVPLGATEDLLQGLKKRGWLKGVEVVQNHLSIDAGSVMKAMIFILAAQF